MTAPIPVSRLADIADRYDVILCDVWGVIHNGRESFPEACEALATFARSRGPVVLISNAPRPSSDVLPQLDALGVPRNFMFIACPGPTFPHDLGLFGGVRVITH